MLQLERQNDILRLLNEKKELTVKELCALLYCSPATVRRDLEALEKKGALKRSFGGAVLSESFSDQIPLFLRSAKRIPEKKRICAKAAAFFRPGTTVFVDASSTTCFLAPYLRNIPELTVITNNPHLNIRLSECGIHNLCTGGEMLNGSIAMAGSDAIRFVESIHADAFFFSARGVCDGEISDSSKAERDIKTAMAERAAHLYFLCDTSKHGLRFPYTVARLSDMDAVIDEN